MSKAQEVRQKVLGRKTDRNPKSQILGKEYYNWTLALIERLAQSRKITEDVKICFEPYSDGKVYVCITPEIDTVKKKKVDIGYTEKEFDLEAFQVMKRMFSCEEGYTVEIGKKIHCEKETGNYQIDSVNVTMHL